MILPDVNLLIFAHNPDAPLHTLARDWWDACLSGPEGVALAWVGMLGFIRITTNPRLHTNPFTPSDACERVDEWLSLPHFQIVHPAPDHFPRIRSLLENLGTAGNLTTDAHLAALAIERGLILHTSDADFARFPGLKWINPLR